MSEPRLRWMVPETAGGIRTYAEGILPALGAAVEVEWRLPEPAMLANAPVEIFHLQHEFGLFGSKLPGRYRFPKWFAGARAATPGKKWIATAHTVIDRNWKYRGGRTALQIIARKLLNLGVPFFRRDWIDGTWGGFDGVIVHSALQRPVILESGCPRVAVIPHYVAPQTPTVEPSAPLVLLFGYFSPEKGQDLAIDAWARLGVDAPKLVLAGGVRRPEDRAYSESCLAAIRRHGLADRIEVTGFVPTDKISDYFSRASLVIAPFRETSGSGSLAIALGHGAAILASDLDLNREIAERVPESIALFRAGSADALAQAVRTLMSDAGRRATHRRAALRYAQTYSPEKIAELHRAFYREVREAE